MLGFAFALPNLTKLCTGFITEIEKMNKKKMGIMVLSIFVMIGMGVVTACAENIDPDNDDSQYAYGENVGYFNFEPGGNGGSGAEVTNSAVTGYVWGENIGWINLSPALMVGLQMMAQVIYLVMHGVKMWVGSTLSRQAAG